MCCVDQILIYSKMYSYTGERCVWRCGDGGDGQVEVGRYGLKLVCHAVLQVSPYSSIWCAGYLIIVLHLIKTRAVSQMPAKS